MSNPFFSIILPTFNRADFLDKAISSVMNQTIHDFELIIVDDGSTDNTKEIVDKWGDKRIKYLYKVNEERGIARNFGAAQALGKYLNFFDSDDILYPNFLATAAEAIREFPDLGFFHIDYEFIDEAGRVYSRGKSLPRFLNEHLFSENQISVLGVFVRKDIFEETQFINHRSAVVAEDLCLWLRIASRHKFYHIPKVRAAIVLHKSRSLNDRSPFKFLKSALLIINTLSNDKVFMTHNNKQVIVKFFAKNLTQSAAMYAHNNKKLKAFYLLKKGMGYSWSI